MSRFYRSSRDHLLDFFRGLRSEVHIGPKILAWKFGEVLERNNRYPDTLVTVFYLAARATTDSAFACFANDGARQAGKAALLQKLEKWCAVASGKMGMFDQRSLSNLMGAFYALRVRPPENFLGSWAQRVPSQLKPDHYVSLQEITTALAGLAIYPDEKVSKVLVSGTEELGRSLKQRDILEYLYRLAVLDSLCLDAGQTSLKETAQELAHLVASRVLSTTNGKGASALSTPERRQLLTVLQWFSEEPIKGIEAPYENGTVSASEGGLRKSFEAAGAYPQAPVTCLQTGHKFDLAMRFGARAQRPVLLEYDGPCHFVRGVKGDVFYDGSTIFQTRLHGKTLSEEVIVRVPYFVHESQKENKQMWYRASEAIEEAASGIYILEETGGLTPFCDVIQKPLSYCLR
jgi:hypothetical protein